MTVVTTKTLHCDNVNASHQRCTETYECGAMHLNSALALARRDGWERRPHGMHLCPLHATHVPAPAPRRTTPRPAPATETPWAALARRAAADAAWLRAGAPGAPFGGPDGCRG